MESEVGTTFDYEAITGWRWSLITWDWFTIIQLASSIIGILGNLLVLVVLFQRRSHGRSTDTLVSALAVADLFAAVFTIPLPSASRVPWAGGLGWVYCKIVYFTVLYQLCFNMSIYTLTAISVERFYAVVHPISFRHKFTRSRTQVVVIIMLVVIIGILVACLIPYIHDDDTARCYIDFTNPTSRLVFGLFALAMQFVIPIATMLVTQSIIIWKLHVESRRFSGIVHGQSTPTVSGQMCSQSSSHIQNPATFHVLARNRLIKLMLVVILAFILLTSPYHISFLLYNFNIIPPSFRGTTLDNLLTLLAYWNCVINPFIYTARFPEFRAAIKGLLVSGARKNAALFDVQLNIPLRQVKQ